MNYLGLALVTRRFRGPLIWSMIEGCGCQDVTANNALRLTIAAKPLKGKWLIIATNIDLRTAINTYRKRWAIECLFGDAKTRSLNLEDTRLTDPRKLGPLMSLTALALG